MFVHNGILFSHEEWNFVIGISKWMELEIVLIEANQAQKAKNHMGIIDLKQMQKYWTWVTH
jgi:hypothetical protein